MNNFHAMAEKAEMRKRGGGVTQTGLVLVCVCLYWNSLQCGFVFDDISAIRDNRDLRPHVPISNLLENDFWGTPMKKEQSHKSYRPLTVFTFRINYLLHELHPLGYHLTNVLLHAGVTLLYHHLCGTLLSGAAAALAALLFAVHPVHTEAVTGVVGRAELLASVFFLTVLVQYGKIARRPSVGWRCLMWLAVLVTLAMLSKEQGITVIAMCALHEVFVAQRLSPKDFVSISQALASGKAGLPDWVSVSGARLCVLVVTGVVLLLGRLKIMGTQLPVFTRFDNPAAVASSPARQLTQNYLLSLNWWLLLAPADLCCDWTMNTVPLVRTVADHRNLATIALYALLCHLAYRGLSAAPHQEASVILTGLGLLVLPFLPATNLLFPVGFVVAERILYLPSMGFCLLVAFGCDKIFRKGGAWRHLAAVGLVITLAIHSFKTVTRNSDWKDEYSLFTSGLKVNSGNAKLFNNVGHALESQGKYQEALEYFHEAVRVQPDDIGAHINVGRTYNHMSRFEDAEAAYLKAKSLLPRAKPGESYQARVAPNHLNVFLNLATLIAKNGSRLEEADLLYRQAISMRSDYTQAYINRGDILLKLNRTKEAQEVYERALFYDSTNADIYYNLGVVLLEQGRHNQALAYLNKALEYDPDHSQALLNSAMLIQESGSTHLRQLALERLHKIVSSGQVNERVYFNLGMLSMDGRDLTNAEVWFRKAIEVKPDFRSALFNLALLLSDSDRPLEAAPFLHQLIKHHAAHTKGLILLGDIYINHLRDLDAAEACYRKILSSEPHNVQGLHNLCVVMVERGQLGPARDCLRSAHHIAPQEEYITRHLEIVQTKIKETMGDI
jgi:tetratricopeptide (TPR) repeat protein